MRQIYGKFAAVPLGAFLLFALLACSTAGSGSKPVTAADPDLKAHSAEFKREILKVTDGVYVAIGFGLANSVLIEGDDGIIIVDTMESAEAALPVKMAFKKITSKPVRAIIYTHYHTDHTLGARIMAGADNPDVYSHEETLYYLERIVNVTRGITYKRAMRQFGTLLPEGGVVNAGIGPYLMYDRTKTAAFLMPNRNFSNERLELEISGIKLELVHAPGETPDQIYIWLPEKKVLLPADNFYKSFPNLYAIRGTPYRDVMRWVDSLDKMRALDAEYLVPHHTRPVIGNKEIHETLTNYRDAIQFVHDQTIRLMNKGLTPEEIVERVKLPGHLSRLPYLHEYYGTVAWSVRAIYDGYLGWFGGNPTELFPLSVSERAKRFARLAGGEKALMEHAVQSAKDKDYQWTLELTDHLLSLDPENREARSLRAEALNALAVKQTAATARNYYLTSALEVFYGFEIGELEVKDKDILRSMPLAGFFKSMAVNLNPAKSADMESVVGFRFPDSGEEYTVHVRRGVAEIQPRFPENPDNTVTVDSQVWKEILAGVRNPALSLIKGELQIEGGTFKLINFLGMFGD